MLDKKLIDKAYHEEKSVISSYDRRITRKYLLEHKYFTVDNWVKKCKAENKKLILDFGCGTGGVSLPFLKAGIKTVSMDASFGMVNKLREKVKLFKLECYCVVGDAENLPFKNGSFDALTCAGVLHHISDIKKGLAEQLRVLKENGLLFISEPFMDSPGISHIYKFIIKIGKKVFRLFKGKSLETLESPLSSFDLRCIIDILNESAVETRFSFLAYWPFVFGYLPDFLGYPLLTLINLFKEPGKGDTVIICARKKHG